MTLVCPVCDEQFKEGDTVVAEVVTTYHQLASKKTYAVDKDISDCYGLVHEACYTKCNVDLNEPNND